MLSKLFKLALVLSLSAAAYGATATSTITGTIRDLTQALVTSGKVTFALSPSRDTTISGYSRFSPQTVTCSISGTGQIVALDGVSACIVTMNTALQPTGSYYVVSVWPYNVKTSSFNFYAVLASYDWSTVVPTPSTSPAQNFVDVFSNQTVGGDKTWTGTQTISGNESVGGNFSDAGSFSSGGPNTLGGATTTQSMNGIQFADQFPGPDFCSKLLAASQSAGVGVVDASGFAGTTQSCASSINLTASHVLYRLPANLDVVAPASVTITISGNDAIVMGAGDSTLFDFSAGTSAASNIVITGNRVTLSNFRVNGNRAAGGTSSSVYFSSVDRPRANNLTITNSGGSAITFVNSTNGIMQGNVVTSTGLTGLYIDGSASNHRILENAVIDGNLSNTGGHGAIMSDGGFIATESSLVVSHNTVKELTTGANHVGIGLSGTKIEISLNTVTANGVGGECIAVTGTSVKILGNTVQDSGASGILFYALTGYATDFEIADNLSLSNGASGISVAWGSDNLTISDGSIHNNRMNGNTSYGLQAYNGGTFLSPANKNIVVSGNQWLGNTAGTFSLLNPNSWMLYGNTDVDNSNTVNVPSGALSIVTLYQNGTNGFAGTSACVGSTKAITFGAAYTSQPAIFLFDETTKGGVNISAKSVSGFSAACTGATDVFDWVAIGNKN